MSIRCFLDRVRVLSIGRIPIRVLLIRSDPVRVLSIRSDPIRSGLILVLLTPPFESEVGKPWERGCAFVYRSWLGRMQVLETTVAEDRKFSFVERVISFRTCFVLNSDKRIILVHK